MLYSQSPPLTAEATSAEATSSGWLARDPGARSDHPYRFGAAGERPAVDWQANIPHPYLVLYCGSHRCRRHAWLAVLR